jgi:hypothetical protein
MASLLTLAVALAWLAVLVVGWLGCQLLRQNGRILLRLDEAEKRLNELELGAQDEPEGLPVGTEAPAFELPDLVGGRQDCESNGHGCGSVVAAGECVQKRPTCGGSNFHPATFDPRPST